MSLRLLAGLLWAGIVVSTGTALADIVTLRNGQPDVVGTLVSVTETQVVLRDVRQQWVSLPRANVQSIRFEPLSPGTALSTRKPVPPTPPPPVRPDAPLADNGPATEALLRFPDPNGKGDDPRVVILARFRGQQSKQWYAGLYHVASQRGTLWLRLSEDLPRTQQLQFDLFGKQQANQPLESFEVQARYLDADGRTLSQSTTVGFNPARAEPIESFQWLEGIAGLAGQQTVRWTVPAGTRTVELRAASRAQTGDTHLVGYLSNLTLAEPEPERRGGFPFNLPGWR